MIRTRDFILFLVAFCFLVLAIVATMIYGGSKQSGFISFDDVPPVVEGVTESLPPESPEEKRQSTIARLREKIKDSPILRSASPSVVATVPEESTATSSTESESDAIADEDGGEAVRVTKCNSVSDGFSVAKAWPREGVVLGEVSGMRVVTYQSNMEVRELIVLPMYPAVGGANCLDSEIIGVTQSGSLIFNNDAIAYQYTGSESLIGYARDGVPIYGPYEGATDSCGGYQHSSGYRYAISKERSYIIGCFSGTASPFSL